MKQQIIQSISDPEQLEMLYRQDPGKFENSFSEISGDYETSLVRFWEIRLKFGKQNPASGTQLRDFLMAAGIALFTAILILIPAIFTGVDKDFFYLRNMPLIAFTGLIIYSFIINKDSNIKHLLLFAIILIASGVYINLLPTGQSDSILIAILHVPLMLWCFFGISYLEFKPRSSVGRMDFIRFNAEMLIMTGLILLAGALLTVITLGLFEVIGMNIEKFYGQYIAIPGAAASPVIGYYLIRTYPGITSKIAPVIARVFSPFVLVTLTVYLISLLFSKSSILENREMLIIFNVMLLGVLALIVFSVSEIKKNDSGKRRLLVQLLLASLAIIINSIALIAIISRLTDGITPNRAIVLITNILVFIHLVMITGKLFKSSVKGASMEGIEKSVTGYLTIYAVWTVIAVFLVPLIFGFN